MNEDDFGIPPMEMARLGQIDNRTFWAYTEPLKKKSIHIRSSDFEVVVSMPEKTVLEIKFNKKSYPPFKKGQPLPGVVMNLLDAFLMAKHSRLGVSNLEYFESVWDSLNP